MEMNLTTLMWASVARGQSLRLKPPSIR